MRGKQIHMSGIENLAPSGTAVVDYDRHHLSLYAALLDAQDAGRDWREAATDLMQLDVADRSAEACWRSHVERARWIISEGMESALIAFSERKPMPMQG